MKLILHFRVPMAICLGHIMYPILYCGLSFCSDDFAERSESVLASIFIAGIVAAGMSTIDGILVTQTGAVTRDIYQKLINKKATDELSLIHI